MKFAIRTMAFSVLASVLLPGISQAQHDDEAGRWTTGQQLYDKVCGHCHKPEVGVGPSLTGRNLPDAYIKVFVRNGLNAMPAFPASHVDDASITLIAEYLASLPPAPEPTPASNAP